MKTVIKVRAYLEFQCYFNLLCVEISDKHAVNVNRTGVFYAQVLYDIGALSHLFEYQVILSNIL